MKNQLDALLKQEMTRKEFLQYIGGALLVSLGITSLLKSLMQSKPGVQTTGLDYGASAYGGIKKNSL